MLQRKSDIDAITNSTATPAAPICIRLTREAIFQESVVSVYKIGQPIIRATPNIGTLQP